MAVFEKKGLFLVFFFFFRLTGEWMLNMKTAKYQYSFRVRLRESVGIYCEFRKILADGVASTYLH